MRWRWCSFEDLTTAELYAALAVRQRVFVVEQACVYQDADGLDLEARHLLGWDGAALVAYLRALPPGRLHPDIAIGRVLTAGPQRGRGLGRKLMLEGMRRARQTFGEGPIRVSAQTHLESFYRSLGFAPIGPEFLEDGIPHLPMRAPG